MPEMLGAFAPKRRSPRRVELVPEVRASVYSLGGAIVLALSIVLVTIAIAVIFLPDVNPLQRFIAVALAGIALVYLLDSSSERLVLSDGIVEFRSFLSRGRSVPLVELDAMLLTHQGFSLEHGVEVIEFRRRGSPPDKISLGPCWRREHLNAFLETVEIVLNEPLVDGEVE